MSLSAKDSYTEGELQVQPPARSRRASEYKGDMYGSARRAAKLPESADDIAALQNRKGSVFNVSRRGSFEDGGLSENGDAPTIFSSPWATAQFRCVLWVHSHVINFACSFALPESDWASSS